MLALVVCIVVAEPAPLAPAAEDTSPPAAVMTLPPETELALEVARTLGPTIKRLMLRAGAQVTDEERERVATLLGRAGLFEVVANHADAAGTLELVRNGDDMVARWLADGREPLEVARSAWPFATPPSAADQEAIFERVRAYERERLRTQPVVRSTAGVLVGAYGPWLAPGRHWDVAWSGGYVAPAPVSTAPNDFVVIRGAAEVLDDVELAMLVGDTQLARSVEEARLWPRITWAIGFGLGAVAGVSSGLYLYDTHDRDRQAVGASLLTLGIASGVLALLAPTLGNDHVLSASQAEVLVDDYNTRLRRRLAVTPDDVRRFKD